MQFTVKRAHQGDKWYAEGDTREASLAEVQHLVSNGVLEQVKEPAVEAKAEPAAPQNKAMGRAPANKKA